MCVCILDIECLQQRGAPHIEFNICILCGGFGSQNNEVKG